MHRTSAGISGKYARSGNDDNQPDNHTASARCGRYRQCTVRHRDNPPRPALGHNEFYHSPGARPHQHLLRRSVNIAQDFNALIKKEIINGLVSKSDRLGDRYDGRDHGLYASSIKKYTSTSKRPLNRAEQGQLIHLLQNFTATRSWNWRSLTTTLHSFTSAGVFTAHNPIDERVKRTQVALLSTLLDAIIFNCNQKPEVRDIDARGIANQLWAMAKLVDNGQVRTPEIEKAMAALLSHVNALKDQFIPQHITNLLWAMAKLVDSGQEQTSVFKGATAALLPLVNAQKDQFNAQGITNLLWAMAKLVDSGQERTPELKEAVAALLPHVSAQRANFTPQGIANLLWAMAKLVDNRYELTPGLKEALAALLPLVNAKNNQFIPQHIANLLWAMAKLVDNRQEQTPELNEAVAALLSHVSAQKANFKPQEIVNLLWAMAKLVDNGQEQTPGLNKAVVALLPHVNTHKDQFNARGIANLLWAMAKLVDKGLERTPQLKEAVATLLPFVNAQKANFKLQEITNLLWATAKLVDNGLERTSLLTEAVAGLLPLVNTAKANFNPQEIANLLWAMVKLLDNGLDRTPELKEAVAALLPHVNAKKDNFTPQGIASLLWAMAKLVDSGQERTPGLNEAVAALLPHVNAKKDQFKALGITNLLWAMAKLVDNGLERTPELNKAVAALLQHVNAHKNLFNAQHIANLLWAMAKLVDNGEWTSELDEAVAVLLRHVNAQKASFKPQEIANLLWATAKLGEFVELNAVTSMFESLVYRISENPQLSQQNLLMSLWGVMVCCARLSMDSRSNNWFEKQMDDLFARVENTSPDNLEDQSVIAMAASWLGRACPVVPLYRTTVSKPQAEFRNQLQSCIPSLQIEEEKSLNSLPPVDLLLPDHNMVIEIQGPFHYVGADFKTRNGSTLLKIALLQKAGFEVIEIPANQLLNNDLMKPYIDQIKIRTGIPPQGHGSVSLKRRWADEACVTADDRQPSDHGYLNAQEHLEEQTGTPAKRKRKNSQ
ncbi:RAP domain-containing protein [Endozoicomonas acroporae]|uniref:RAP domain-containing protein n=2 Tax=Endozoicomonas acroporae TaxID=1701104 RepID=UPI0013D0E17D|nr:RAP domain-containing protein [Endozoicomonas acroporae]